MTVLTALDSGKRLVIGHRGAAARAPENTFAGFDHALSLGVDAIEFDVRLSRDGVAVVIHDPTLDRTTNATGTVASRTARELSEVDAGARLSSDGRSFPFAGQGIGVPTFEDLLIRYPETPLLIELKEAAAAPEVLRLLRRHGSEARAVVDSLDAGALRLFRDEGVTTGAAKRDVLSLMLRSAIRMVPRALRYQALCIPERYGGITVPVERLADAAARRGAPTHVWTVNDPADARRLWGAGVIGIISDDPAQMLELRRALA